MSRTIAFAGALAAALLVVSTGTAAAQNEDGASTGSLDPSSVTGSVGGGTADEVDEGALDETEGPLGSVGELAPASVTGSLPGYTTGPVGSVANAACAAGTVAGWAANLVGIPLPVPIGLVCTAARPIAESVDHLSQGDVDGSVEAVIGGVPVVGGSLGDFVDTGSATESVQESVGEAPIGSLADSSLSPAN